MTNIRKGGIRSIKSSVRISVGVSLAALGVQHAAAQDLASASGAVETMLVTGQREGSQSFKFTQPLQDTPQTIQVIDKNLFLQQGATTLTEALRNSPGVGTFYAGENGNTSTGDAVYMRGFDTSNSIFVDGVRDLGSISRDVFNTEQIEVQKGPAGTDNGAAAPSGSINMVSKHAFSDDSLSGSVQVGIDGQKRATADVNQTLGNIDGAALRLNAMWQDSDVAGRDHVNNRRVGLASSLGFGLESDTRVFLNLLYVDQDNIPDGFVPTIGLPGWQPQPGLENLIGRTVDSENFYGTRADHDNVRAQMATLRIEHDFSDTLKLRNTTRWGQTKQDYLLSAFMSTGGNTDDPTAGNINWTDIDDLSTYTLKRSLPTVKDQKSTILTNQLHLRADFATGDIAHAAVLGVEVTREKVNNHAIATQGSLPAANLFNPDWDDVGDLSLGRSGAGSLFETDTQSAYLFDTVKFLEDTLLVTGGLRLDHYKTDYFSSAVCNNGTGRGAVACGAEPLGSIVTTADLRAKDTLFNWKLGAVYKPLRALSLYANYALSQQPPGRANASLSSAANNASNPNMDPQKAKTIEAGAKWSTLNNRLLLNAAVFQTTVTNEINTLELDDAGNPTQTGRKRVKGIELSVVGNLTEAWSISAGYSHMNTKVLDGTLVTKDGSSNLAYTPDDAFTAWTNYRLPFDLTVGGGVRYTGKMHRGTDGAVNTPEFTESWVVVDAIVSYPVSENFMLRVNGYNLFDKDYVAAINKSGYRYTPGVPRTVLFSGDFRF